MSYRTPLGKVRGLGAAREGTRHFWMQRLTAVALVPLGVWLVASLVAIAPGDYATAAAWVATPWVTVTLLVLVLALFHHAQLGLQVVVEDYVQADGIKILCLVVLKLGAILLGTAAAVAVLTIAFRGP